MCSDETRGEARTNERTNDSYSNFRHLPPPPPLAAASGSSNPKIGVASARPPPLKETRSTQVHYITRPKPSPLQQLKTEPIVTRTMSLLSLHAEFYFSRKERSDHCIRVRRRTTTDDAGSACAHWPRRSSLTTATRRGRRRQAGAGGQADATDADGHKVCREKAILGDRGSRRRFMAATRGGGGRGRAFHAKASVYEGMPSTGLTRPTPLS